MPDEKIDLTAEAPTLIAAGVSEDQLQADLAEKVPVAPVVPAIPAHHLLCCYQHLKRGDTVEQAARAAGIPLDVAQTIAGEVDAVCAKIGSTSPVKKAVVEAPVEGEEIKIG